MRPGMSSNVKKPAFKLNRLFVIIPAIGLGTKADADSDKQFIEVDGIPVIERTLNAFKEFETQLSKAGTTLRAVIVTDEAYVYKINGMCRYKKYEFIQNVVSGGATRMESVWKGIEALSDLPFPPTDEDIVLIHDGSRCLIDEDTLERCLESALTFEIVAASVPTNSVAKAAEPKVEAPASEPAPVEEEPKKSALGLDLSKFPSLAGRLGKTDVPPIARPGLITQAPVEEPKPIFKPAPSPVTATPEPKTVTSISSNREDIEVQSPQLFRYSKLLKSYVNGIKRNLDAADDISLAEALNFKVRFVDGSVSNIKVTTESDAEKAEKILKSQEVQQ